MQDRKTNLLSAVGYAVFFVAFMIWWTGARDVTSILMLSLCGAFNGAIWYWLFNSGARWIIRRDPIRRA